MYLKRIETIGFKSFADKTVVEFERGVTAVVGPNGSGRVIFQIRFVGYRRAVGKKFTWWENGRYYLRRDINS